MASRRQRQRKQEQRKAEQRRPMEATYRSLTVVNKAESKQLAQEFNDATFADMYSQEKAIKPPIPLDALLTLTETDSTHAACVNAKATDSVGRGWHLEHAEEHDVPPEEPEDAEGDRPTSETTELAEADEQAMAEEKLREWLKSVCTRLRFAQLVKQAYREYDSMGWGVWEVVRESADVSSAIVELLPVPGQTLRATTIPGVYVQQRENKKVYFKEFGMAESVSSKVGDKPAAEEDDEANEIIIFKQYSPRSDHYGVPYWVSAASDLAELAAIREFNIKWFESGGKVDRLVHVKDSNIEEARNLSESIINKMRESAKKSNGHVSVVTYGGDTSEVNVETLEPKGGDGTREGQFKEERRELRSQVLIAHQVPPYRVGLAEMGSLGGNAAQEMLEAYRFGTIEDGQETFEEILDSTIFNPEMGGYDLGGWSFQFNDVDWEELERDIGAAAKAVDAGVWTPDEGREATGKEPLNTPESQSLYWNGQPLVSAGTVAEQAASAAASSASQAAIEKVNETLHELRQAFEVIVKADRMHDYRGDGDACVICGKGAGDAIHGGAE